MKKFSIAAALCSAAVLAGCEAMPAGETVVDSLIGKTLTGPNDAVLMFLPGGAMGGTIRGEAVEGVYDANGQEVCSTYTAPDFLTGREFCSVPQFDGDTVTFSRRDGSVSPVYAISG